MSERAKHRIRYLHCVYHKKNLHPKYKTFLGTKKSKEEEQQSSSRETCLPVKKQHLEWDIEQQIGSKLGTEYLVCNCHPA